MQDITDLIETAFIDEHGIVERFSKQYADFVNVYGQKLDKIVIGCQYVKILFRLEQLEKDKSFDYYDKTSINRLENWIKANYKR
jgi:hypothetical protein